MGIGRAPAAPELSFRRQDEQRGFDDSATARVRDQPPHEIRNNYLLRSSPPPAIGLCRALGEAISKRAYIRIRGPLPDQIRYPPVLMYSPCVHGITIERGRSLRFNQAALRPLPFSIPDRSPAAAGVLTPVWGHPAAEAEGLPCPEHGFPASHGSCHVHRLHSSD